MECIHQNSSCEGSVEFEPDPFRVEIHDDRTSVWMCEEHRYQSARDI